VNAFGALTGNQAMQQVKAGLKAIYLSGWQVAGDANNAGTMYPDQSFYIRVRNSPFPRATAGRVRQPTHFRSPGQTDGIRQNSRTRYGAIMWRTSRDLLRFCAYHAVP